MITQRPLFHLYNTHGDKNPTPSLSRRILPHLRNACQAQFGQSRTVFYPPPNGASRTAASDALPCRQNASLSLVHPLLESPTCLDQHLFHCIEDSNYATIRISTASDLAGTAVCNRANPLRGIALLPVSLRTLRVRLEFADTQSPFANLRGRFRAAARKLQRTRTSIQSSSGSRSH